MLFIVVVCLSFILNLSQAFDLAANLTSDQRTAVCQKNLMYCANTCGAPNTKINFCSKDNLLWGCKCSTTPLQVSYHSFPIQSQQCQGEVSECQQNCVLTMPVQIQVQSCSIACSTQAKCGSPLATETKNFTSPDYQPPDGIPSLNS